MSALLYWRLCGILLSLQGGYADACAQPPPPPVHEACWHVTNYYPFDDEGVLHPWRGQADGDPHHTALMVEVTLDKVGRIGATADDYLGAVAEFPDGRRVRLVDAYGDALYSSGVFLREDWTGEWSWVLGIDIMSPEPLSYRECHGRLIYDP